MKRIAGLDGLRGISIMLVLTGHASGCLGPQGREYFGDLGNLGVRMFFIISGYLITLLLLSEYKRTGSISLKQFYIRRTLRIFPAFYFFLLVVAVLHASRVLQLNSGDLLHAVTYTMNYHANRGWWLGHIWSLSNEEQFYLLWPAMLLILGPRRGMFGAVAAILIAPAVRVFEYKDVWFVDFSFSTVADSIATGALLAGCKEWLLERLWFCRIVDCSCFWTIAALIVAALNSFSGGRFRYAVIETALNVVIAICICRAVTRTDDVVGVLLNSRPLIFLGTISYSLYLWQQLFLTTLAAPLCRFPLNICMAFGAAVICHLAVEKPFLALRNRLRQKSGVRVRCLGPGGEIVTT